MAHIDLKFYTFLPWDDPANKLELRVFESIALAIIYRKFQKLTTRELQIRKFKMPDHRWANKRGNVIVVRKPAGHYVTDDGYKMKTAPLYLFDNGTYQPAHHRGLLKD